MSAGRNLLGSRSHDEVLDTSDQWKTAMVEKGWT
jgi:hypothetical protein